MEYEGRFLLSGTGEECARAIRGAESELLEERERTCVLVNGERLRGCDGRVKMFIGDGVDSVGESGAVERR